MIDIKFYKPLWLSEIGKKENNQDSVFPKKNEENSNFFAVCDGVGGQPTGEVASVLACKSIEKYFLDNNNKQINSIFFTNLYKFIQEKFITYNKKNPASNGMATTLTLLTFHSGGYTATWSGDSKIYHIRNSEILFSNETHSTDDGKIYSAVNDKKVAQIGLYNSNDIQKNDFFILCSDGILEGISENKIENLCLKDANPESVINTIKQNCSENSTDNFSLYLLKVKESKTDFSLLKKNTKTKNNNKNLILKLLLVLFIVLAIAEGFILFKQNNKEENSQKNTNIIFEYQGDTCVSNKNLQKAKYFYSNAIKETDNDTIVKFSINAKLFLLQKIDNLKDTIKNNNSEIKELQNKINQIYKISKIDNSKGTVQNNENNENEIIEDKQNQNNNSDTTKNNK